MRAEHDGVKLVRAELCERLDTLQAMSRRISPKDFAQNLRSIRTIAAAYGLYPVVRLADALERTMEDGGRHGCSSALYLDRLHDAIGCRSFDEASSQAMLASVSVRLGA